MHRCNGRRWKKMFKSYAVSYPQLVVGFESQFFCFYLGVGQFKVKTDLIMNGNSHNFTFLKISYSNDSILKRSLLSTENIWPLTATTQANYGQANHHPEHFGHHFTKIQYYSRNISISFMHFHNQKWQNNIIFAPLCLKFDCRCPI